MYNIILSIFYPIFLALVFPTQIFLFVVVVKYSPKYMQTLRNVLFCNCIFQTISVVLLCLLQLRQVSHLKPMEIWCYGPLRHFEAIISYCLYFVSQSTSVVSNILVLLTIYLKYEAAKNVTNKQSNKCIVIILLLVPVFVLVGAEIYSVVTHSLLPEVRYLFEVINSNVTDHSVIGYITLQTVPSYLIISIVFGSVFLLPPMGLYTRRKIIFHINSGRDTTSQLKKHQRKTFINGLTLQACLPLVSLCPIFVCYVIVIGTKSELLFEQYCISVLVLLPTFFDPYITLYSVAPYRKQIGMWLGKAKTGPMIVISSIMNL
ncbi:Serpentine receptor class delta-47 [Caenorhabditis elegans]|uniref:Serpentine receptor class delta-47 n=1 Tax=Caenorhabditis elegans TaxID=6239 RepID=SRD47_CAEEL|nr:Serpentine receptor class delta-47 [Caenorhabditis elegans]Q19507.2 RecName: Full=Serpentine receptor class delta-47; Short=Protein srd-47 [Caenorhabditis elegans]CAA92162.1 Serpentine receptor class delta-47 [Caenorhabditis elegans]|eukprot:NP_510066.1 Serpentine receptor class delta-47 [Caenorhabditis elegans]